MGPWQIEFHLKIQTWSWNGCKEIDGKPWFEVVFCNEPGIEDNIPAFWDVSCSKVEYYIENEDCFNKNIETSINEADITNCQCAVFDFITFLEDE